MNTSNDLQKQPSGIQIQAPEKLFSVKKLTFILLAMCLFSLLVDGRSETYCGKQVQQVASLPCPGWYADNEFNVRMCGTYAFTGNEWPDDPYGQADHACDGGVAPHIGWAGYFSWKFVDRPPNNFGMVRTVVNFAF